MLKSLFAAALLVGLATAPALSEDWTYTDGTGQTVTLDHIPNRIVMHANTAAGLIPLGIRPIAIYVDTPVAEDKSLQGLDLTGIEIVGEAWGQIDIEKVAALKPDLFLAEWWPLDKAFSGLESGAGSTNQQILKLAPITGPTQGDSIVKLIADYEVLAESLGATFVDSDEEIEKAAGLSVQEIFERHGEPEFRRGERRVIERLLNGPPIVLATGGGAYIDPATRAMMKEKATTVWLRAELDLIWKRVNRRDTRPLLKRENPKQVLADLNAARSPIYAEADIVVDSGDQPASEAAKAIREKLGLA